MKLLTLSLAAAAALFFVSPASAQVPRYSPQVQEKIQLVTSNLLPAVLAKGDGPFTLQQRMAYYNVRGVSIAVIRNYKVEWAAAYGWADEGLKKPVTTKTLFQAGSVSKSFNAIGVLRLVQDKKINLYTDINNYLTSWKFPYDLVSKNKKITMANLLSHTAGLNLHGFPGYENGQPLPTIVQVLSGLKPANTPAVKSIFEPGLRYEYSGGGITISQLIVMNVTHLPYDEYMYHTVLKPLGMTASSYTQPPADNPDLLATGYDEKGGQVKGRYHIYPEQAAAGLWTNPTELAKYIIETQLSLQGKSNKVLNQQMTELRLTPYIDKSAALGVFIDDFNGQKYFEHSGSDVGFMTQYYGSMTGGNGVVVMVNSNVGAIMNEIVNSVANVYGFKGLNRSVEKEVVAVPEDVLQQYTGKYQLAPNFILTISRQGSRMFGQATGQDKLEIFAEAQNKFFLKLTPIEIEFVKDAGGAVTKAVLYQSGVHEAKKIE